jgi:phospholipid-binding lipoprotein MlaA
MTLAGCVSPTDCQRALHTVDEIDDERIAVAGEDPWEGFNRNMYKFNYRLDKYFLLPIVSGYEFITPTLLQKGVSNFFNNIGEFRTMYNSLLQAKGEKFLMTFGRFLTNSTIGLGGLFDPATSLGMARQNEDFGQTLAVWGADSGPYLVMPLLGPGTVRSAGGFMVDSLAHYGVSSAIGVDKTLGSAKTLVTGLKAIDNRHQQPFRYYGSDFPFEYEMVRFLYRQKRELEVMK